MKHLNVIFGAMLMLLAIILWYWRVSVSWMQTQEMRGFGLLREEESSPQTIRNISKDPDQGYVDYKLESSSYLSPSDVRGKSVVRADKNRSPSSTHDTPPDSPPDSKLRLKLKELRNAAGLRGEKGVEWKVEDGAYGISKFRQSDHTNRRINNNNGFRFRDASNTQRHPTVITGSGFRDAILYRLSKKLRARIATADQNNRKLLEEYLKASSNKPPNNLDKNLTDHDYRKFLENYLKASINKPPDHVEKDPTDNNYRKLLEEYLKVSSSRPPNLTDSNPTDHNYRKLIEEFLKASINKAPSNLDKKPIDHDYRKLLEEYLNASSNLPPNNLGKHPTDHDYRKLLEEYLKASINKPPDHVEKDPTDHNYSKLLAEFFKASINKPPNNLDKIPTDHDYRKLIEELFFNASSNKPSNHVDRSLQYEHRSKLTMERFTQRRRAIIAARIETAKVIADYEALRKRAIIAKAKMKAAGLIDDHRSLMNEHVRDEVGNEVRVEVRDEVRDEVRVNLKFRSFSDEDSATRTGYENVELDRYLWSRDRFSDERAEPGDLDEDSEAGGETGDHVMKLKKRDADGIRKPRKDADATSAEEKPHKKRDTAIAIAVIVFCLIELIIVILFVFKEKLFKDGKMPWAAKPNATKTPPPQKK